MLCISKLRRMELLKFSLKQCSYYIYETQFCKGIGYSKAIHTATRNSGVGSDRQLYMRTRKGNYEKDKRRLTFEEVKGGFFQISTEIEMWKKEMIDKFDIDILHVRPGDSEKVFEFNTQKCLDNFIVTCDSDWNEGKSTATLVLSPSGHGLFSGFIDKKSIPVDGQTGNVGYANITCIPKQRSFAREIYHDWSLYNHLILRVRGDGRRYSIYIDTSGEYDITWNDRFVYTLYTRGGPYWQDVKIPFSKFLLSSAGRVQDLQFPIPSSQIRTLGITAADNVTNTFQLEIDYIGVHLDTTHKEEFAYEMYRVPPFSAW